MSSIYKKNFDTLRAGRELGYVEGQNLIIESRWAEDQYDRLPELAAELVRLDVDILITHGTPGTLAAKCATTTIPIVMAVVGDAMVTGVVASLSRPRDHRNDDHPPGRARVGAVALEPSLPRRKLLHRRPQLGAPRGICVLRRRRLAVRVLYFVLFASLGIYTWWLGALTGLLHGLFLLVAGLPLLPSLHPRMAFEYDGATATRQLEPPGFMGLNYGPARL